MRNRVDFIVVGGVAAIVEGAPITTKEFANSAKDRAVLPVLRKTLALRQNGA